MQTAKAKRTRPAIKVTSSGTPSPELAEDFARLLVESMKKKPALKVVCPDKLAKHDDLHKFANR